MAFDKTSLTSRRGYENQIGLNPTGWREQFGSTFGALFKPFTTYNIAGGLGYDVAHYFAETLTPATTNFKATSTYLNPYGTYTLYEGIISGTGLAMPQNMNTFMDSQTVRGFGMKTPATYVGPGYDVFGYPVPNANNVWRASGILGSGMQLAPSSVFKGSGSTPTAS